jgi:hypothetical protein
MRYRGRESASASSSTENRRILEAARPGISGGIAAMPAWRYIDFGHFAGSVNSRRLLRERFSACWLSKSRRPLLSGAYRRYFDDARVDTLSGAMGDSADLMAPASFISVELLGDKRRRSVGLSVRRYRRWLT